MSDLKDSGTRQSFGTGAVRDTAAGKPLFELLPGWSLMAWAWIMEAGAGKYWSTIRRRNARDSAISSIPFMPSSMLIHPE